MYQQVKNMLSISIGVFTVFLGIFEGNKCTMTSPYLKKNENYEVMT